MEASIKMAEQLAPNRRSDRGRMHGLADEGFDAGPFPQADGDHPPALQLAALERGRSSKSSTRLREIELVVAPWPWCTCVRNARRSLLCENVGVGAPGH